MDAGVSGWQPDLSIQHVACSLLAVRMLRFRLTARSVHTASSPKWHGCITYDWPQTMVSKSWICIVAVYRRTILPPPPTFREYSLVYFCRSRSFDQKSCKWFLVSQLDLYSATTDRLKPQAYTYIIFLHQHFFQKVIVVPIFWSSIAILIEACKKSKGSIIMFTSMQPRAWFVLHLLVEIALLCLSTNKSYHVRPVAIKEQNWKNSLDLSISIWSFIWASIKVYNVCCVWVGTAVRSSWDHTCMRPHHRKLREEGAPL